MPRGAVDRSDCFRTCLRSHSGHRKALGAIGTEDQRPQFADTGRRVSRRNESDSRNAPFVYPRAMDRMPQPGDPYAKAFVRGRSVLANGPRPPGTSRPLPRDPVVDRALVLALRGPLVACVELP